MSQQKHPKGLYVLFSTEMWERFNFYGMRAIMTLFLVKCLGFPDSDSIKIYGAYLGLGYLSCMLGGYLSDRFLGNKICIYLGGILMAIAQFLLFISASIFSNNLSLATCIMWAALCFLILGTGIFKPNISSMVGHLYDDKDKRLDKAYTIFYMGINLGSFIGMMVCSTVGDVKDANGVRDIGAFKWGFLCAFGAIILSLLTFYLFSKKYIITPNKTSIGNKPILHTPAVKQSLLHLIKKKSPTFPHYYSFKYYFLPYNER